MRELHALSVASEVYPLIKTGGLADVAGALPSALAKAGALMRTLVPGYPSVMAKLETAETVREYAELFGGSARVLFARAGDLELYALDAPHLYNRAGNPYLDPAGKDYADNAERFAALARVGADLGKSDLGDFRPDVVHVHDWQGALTPAFLHYDGGQRPRTVVTIHNLAFQGHFPATTRERLGLPAHAMGIDGVEYFGGVGYLKAGLRFADKITTVSPTYAHEIMSPEFGMALDGLLRSRAKDVIGIVNGIDDRVWDPAADPAIAQSFNAPRIALRARNKTVLQRRLGMAETANAPLFGVVSRLTSQKGLDLVLDALPLLIERGAQLALLGSGERALEAGYVAAARTHPMQIGCRIGYDEGLAHLVQAGADFLLVPSRFEPCGLTQLCALRYGAVPLVARVGGLADTIIDANVAAMNAGVATGIQFQPPETGPFIDALERAFALYRDEDAMRRIRLNGMKADVSWTIPAARYVETYRAALAEAA